MSHPQQESETSSPRGGEVTQLLESVAADAPSRGVPYMNQIEHFPGPPAPRE
jgi:hypothetical protein